ncbi:hypothetical protein GQ43DRAFT_498971 [Delitschia confertaspora ATCC 74209]|uniref:RNA-dependent RNA polymerase n=1 Tax=Delitschia confertaspora ATCC 74209 TaxID=1513339 RepID=A0A9P4JQT0_9PLEO|nr:hypothetical protein GQ43DRAFT_498971 [Delitschia confertaspora ATCC 74209]
MSSSHPPRDVKLSRAASSRATPPPPEQRSGRQLEQIIQDLQSNYHLSLTLRDHTWSPAKSDKSVSEQVHGDIKRLFWSAYPVLQRVLGDFEEQASQSPRARPQELLHILHRLLRSETGSLTPQRITPRFQTPIERVQSPACKHGHGIPLTLRRGRQSARSTPIQRESRQPAPVSVYTTASQTRPGTPTDVDDSDYEIPPSPSSQAAGRRGRTRAQFDIGPANGRKRPSPSSAEDETSLRLSKTSKGNQSDKRNDGRPLPNSSFARPTPEMAQSSQQTESATTSFSTVWSRTGGQPDTANTSFASEYTSGDVVYPDLNSKNPTNFRPLDEDEHSQIVRSFDEPAQSNPSPSFSHRSTPRVEAESSLIPAVPPPNSSPFKMHYQVRNLPSEGLFVKDIPSGLKSAPFIVRLECTRIAAANKKQPEDILTRYVKNLSTYDGFWGFVGEKHPRLDTKTRDSRKTWEAAKCRFEGYTLKGKLTFDTRESGSIFSFGLDPLQRETQCRLQRKFGSDRFLYLTVPVFDRGIPQRVRAQRGLLEEQWAVWLSTDHAFLGRKWRAFHIEDVKKKKTAVRKGETFNKRIVLFAIEGCDIVSISIGEMLDWFIPLERNCDQSFCKAFARLDLALSRTTPTISFKPSQVEYIADTLADGSREDTKFNDRSLDWSETYPKDVIMNDGCSLISMGAARAIWKALKQPGPIPSAFQGRFGGAKGMWMVSTAATTRDPEHTRIWIKITSSQLKFKPHYVDTSDELPFDELRLTFEVNGWSTHPVPSELHIAFIAIMADRGIPMHTIAALMKRRQNLEREDLLEAIPDPKCMRAWVHKQGSKKEETFRETDNPLWMGGLPQSLNEKIIFGLETGILASNYALSYWFAKFVELQYMWMEQRLGVPLGRATFLLGVADPLGVLESGEIHVQFSSSFVDDFSAESYLGLTDIDLLVGRQPACRRSDLQKVRAVFKNELSHLVDVVVFPSKGKYPLAGKLQGGDYDGDRFWLCWEQDLVDGFKNAPAPLHPPNPADYGIQVEKRKVRQIMNVKDLDTVCCWLNESFKFRNNPGLLGIVTNHLENQSYMEDAIYSPGLEALCAIHDLLVDSAKQGFLFGRKDFEWYIRNSVLNIHPSPPKPAYKRVMEMSTTSKDIANRAASRKKDPKYKKHNPLDYLFFKVVRKHNDETLKLAVEKLKAAEEDTTWKEYYEAEFERSEPDSILKADLSELLNRFDKPLGIWRARIAQENTPASFHSETIEKCYAEYKAVMPLNNEHPVIQRWLIPRFGSLTDWDLLRASALAKKLPFKEKQIFILQMAGREIAYIVLSKKENSRLMDWNAYTDLKPRKARRITKHLEEAVGDEYESGAEEF